MKRAQYWVIVNGRRSMAEAKTQHERRIYPLFFSSKPTVYTTYRAAHNIYRRQIRSYRAKMKEKGMGRGWPKLLRAWIRDLGIVRVDVDRRPR